MNSETSIILPGYRWSLIISEIFVQFCNKVYPVTGILYFAYRIPVTLKMKLTGSLTLKYIETALSEYTTVGMSARARV